MDRHAFGDFPVGPSGARSSCHRHAWRWTPDGKFLRPACGQHRQPRRLHGGRVRRRADQPISASARLDLQCSRDCVARAGGADQYHADRRHAGPGLRRGGQHHRAPDRCGGTAMWFRSYRSSPAQFCHHDADDQRPELHRRQRRLPQPLRHRDQQRRPERIFRHAAGDSEANGRRRGIGVACHIKATGGLPTENVDIRFEPDGTRCR